MKIRLRHKALLACVFVALGLPANFVWWRFIYDILAQGESDNVRLLVSVLVYIGFWSTFIAFVAYTICVMESDK